ncbi:uncharacterized protein LOC117315126 [Pecten maximus]|uniref:uncharacterized protein LOC117315126 n=1 Tax=Pecten maximus TaxID=6579 RepID=UPI0014590439|nr:uncharacterized protein LOC117315126 [Pecten maximus]
MNKEKKMDSDQQLEIKTEEQPEREITPDTHEDGESQSVDISIGQSSAGEELDQLKPEDTEPPDMDTEVEVETITDKGQSSDVTTMDAEVEVQIFPETGETEEVLIKEETSEEHKMVCEESNMSEGSVEVMDIEFNEIVAEEETVVETTPEVNTNIPTTVTCQSEVKAKTKSTNAKGKSKEKKSGAEESYTIVIKVAQGGVNEGEPVTLDTITLPAEIKETSQRAGLRPREPRKNEVKQIIVKQEEEEEEDEDEEEEVEDADAEAAVDQKLSIHPEIRQRLIEQIISKEWAGNMDDRQLTPDERATVEDLLSGRPVRPVERQKMRPWMIELLDKNNVPGLSWQNRRERIFRISWKHAAHNCFNRDRDSDLFERWAIHTGRHYEGNHKRWKANFRCALNSLPDVIELRDLGVRKGDNAFKVYKFLDLNDPVYKDRIDNKGKKTAGLPVKVKGIQQKNVSKTEKYLRTIITRRLKKEADGTLLEKSAASKKKQAEEVEEEENETSNDLSQTVEISDEAAEGGGTLQTLLRAIELQQEKLALQAGQSQGSQGASGKRAGSTLNIAGQSTPKRFRQDSDGNLIITPNMGGSIEQVDGNILFKLDIPSGSASSIIGTSTGIVGSTGVIGSSGGTYVMAVGSASNTATTMSKAVTPEVQGQSIDVTDHGGQPVISVLPLKLPFVDQKGSKVTFIQMPNKPDQEGKVTENIAIPPEIQNLLRQGTQSAGNPGLSGTPAVSGKGIEQKITFPVGGKALSMASGQKPIEVGSVASVPNVGLLNLDKSQGKEQKITIPLSQLAAMMGNAAQAQKIGITINLDGKGQKELSTVSTSLASGGSVLTTGIPVSLMSSSSISSNVNTTLQNGGQGQAFLTLMSGANQGQVSDFRLYQHLQLWVASQERELKNRLPLFPTTSTKVMDTPAGVRNKLVTRLLISGAATSTSQTISSVAPSSTATSTSASPTYNLVFHPNTPLSATTPQLSSPVPQTQVINLQNLTKQQLSALTSSGVLVGQTLAGGQLAKSDDAQSSPASLGVTPPATPRVASPGSSGVVSPSVKVSPSQATSPNLRPELMEQVTIDLKEIQDDNPPVEGETTSTPNFSYSCLWCKIDFNKKIDLLQHFMNLHQDMLMVPGESEVIGQGYDGAGQVHNDSHDQMFDGQEHSVLDVNALDLRTVKTEMIEQTPDMSLSCQSHHKQAKTVKEALSRKKGRASASKEGGTKRQRVKKKKGRNVKNEEGKNKLGEGKSKGDQSRTPSKVDPESNQSSMSATSDARPKYSLTSLIEALRDSIERDKSKKGDDLSNEGGTSDSDMSDESTSVPNVICYDDLSPDSSAGEEGMAESDSEAVDGDIQVSVKTFQVDGKTMYKCSLCAKVFSKTCTFARHAMVHSRMYPYQCGLCDEKCSDMRVLLRHLDWHGENVDCPCKKCERLHKYGDIKTIGEKTSGTSKFVCEICQRSFISDVACKAHVNMHKRSGSLVCEVCNLEFQCNRALSKHRKSVHGIQFCPYCLETCTLDMASHMSEHEGVFMYRCGLCGDGYNSRPLLHEHLKIHTHLGKEFGQQLENEMKSVGILHKKSSTGNKASPESVKNLESSKVVKKEPKKEAKKPGKKKTPKSKLTKPKKQVENTEEASEDVSEVEKKPTSPVKAEPTKILPVRQKTRKCRWHDNDSVCERCDVMFVKKIAFGRKPKSRQGKESPRPHDSNSNSVGYEGDDEKDSAKKDNPVEESTTEPAATEMPTKVIISESMLKAIMSSQNAGIVTTGSPQNASSLLQSSSPQKVLVSLPQKIALSSPQKVAVSSPQKITVSSPQVVSPALQTASLQTATSLLQKFSPQKGTIIQASGTPPRASLLKLGQGSSTKTVLIKTLSGAPIQASLAQLEVKPTGNTTTVLQESTPLAEPDTKPAV